jgi:hypothetical protein
VYAYKAINQTSAKTDQSATQIHFPFKKNRKKTDLAKKLSLKVNSAIQILLKRKTINL